MLLLTGMRLVNCLFAVMVFFGLPTSPSAVSGSMTWSCLIVDRTGVTEKVVFKREEEPR